MQVNLTIARKRILILDDDRELLELFTEFLPTFGYEVQARENADNIFDIIQDYRPDLIIIDYLLPGINGGEICSEIKNSPATKHIPVIIYSAYSRMFLSLGTYHCDCFIEKPFDLAYITGEIERLCWPSHLMHTKCYKKTVSNIY